MPDAHTPASFFGIPQQPPRDGGDEDGDGVDEEGTEGKGRRRPPATKDESEGEGGDDDGDVDEEKLLGAKAMLGVREETQEDIDAWLAERRRRFPTRANVARKQAAERAAIARGELPPAVCRIDESLLLGGPAPVAVSDRTPYPQQKHYQYSPEAYAQVVAAAARARNDTAAEAPAVEAQEALEEKEERAAEAVEEQEDDEAPEETSSKEPAAELERKVAARLERAPGAPPRKQPRRERTRCVELLSRLLENVVHKEKSATLQCIRYIVANNFLQRPPPAPKQQPEQQQPPSEQQQQQ